MNKILAWFAATRIRLSLSHIPESLLIQVPVLLYCVFVAGTPLLYALRTSITAVAAWYWSRKKLEVETERDTNSESHAYTWMYGWFPWEWSLYQVYDFLVPFAWSVLFALVIWKIYV